MVRVLVPPICSELLRQDRKVNLVIVCGRTLSYLNIN